MAIPCSSTSLPFFLMEEAHSARKKVGEEATEMVIAAKNPNDNEVIYEMSDFLYHMMVLMAVKNVSWEDITDELSRR